MKSSETQRGNKFLILFYFEPYDWNSKINLDWPISLFLAKYTDNVAAVQGQQLDM